MATAELNTDTMIVYSVTDQGLALLKEELTGLDAAQDYEACRKGIATCRQLRVEVEKKRKELKADALEYGRKVDGEAKRITAALEAIEQPLQLSKDAVDNEKLRIKREKEEAEKAKIEAELKAKRDAEEAKLKAEREAEAARLAEERKRLEAEQRALVEARRAEQARVEAEQAKLLAAKKAEQDRIDAERRKLAAEKAEIEKQQAVIRAEQETAARIERERVAAEERRKAEEIAAAEHAARVEALKPDKEKIAALAVQLRAFVLPTVTDNQAIDFLNSIANVINDLAADCERFSA